MSTAEPVHPFDLPREERYTLFLEERSRYHHRRAMPPPSELPDDGLSRVIVDCHVRLPFDPRALTREQTVAFAPRTPEQTVTYLRRSRHWSTYPRVVALAAAKLAGPDARLWCAGEMPQRLAAAFAEAAGRDVAVAATTPGYGLVVFGVNAPEVSGDTLWPSFAGEYGGRIFAFDRQGTALEGRIEALERSARAAAPDLPDRWRVLQDDCWERDRLAAICRALRLVVLPDMKHYGTVSFQSVALSVAEMADGIEAVLREIRRGCERVVNAGEEWRRLSDLDLPAR